MESRIGWLGGLSSGKREVDETLVSVNTYTGEEIRLTLEQLEMVEAHRKQEEQSMRDLMEFLGVDTIEAAEAFLADQQIQS